MNNVISRQKELNNGLTVNVLNVLLCLFLLLPDDAFEWCALYESTTPTYIPYLWLKYKFGILQCLLFIIGVYYAIKLNKKNVFVVFIVMLLREMFFFLIGSNNIFSASGYEMYLTLFVGYTFVLWAEGGLKTFQRCELFYKYFLVSNMLTIYIHLALGGSGGLLTGRYHSSNLDVGGTGSLCVICILFLLFLEKKQWYDLYLIILSFVGLFLTGSRANMAFLFFVLAFSFVFNKRERLEKSRANIYYYLTVVSIFIFIVLLISLDYYSNFTSIVNLERLQAMTSTQLMQTDSSTLGRTRSLITGLEILKEHPFGISGYFVNLQSEMAIRGYPTFPHSTLLGMYLLFGPIVFAMYWLWLKLFKRLTLVDRKYCLIIFYMLIASVVYGSPITNFKTVFIYAMSTFLAYLRIKEANRTRI